MSSSKKSAVDLVKRFGIRNFIDRREDTSCCLLCFIEFEDNDCDNHINSEFHQILMNVTEKLKKEDNDLQDSDVSNKVDEENNTTVGNYQTNLGEEAILNSKTVHAVAEVKASTSTAEENIDLMQYAKQNNIRYKNENKQAVCELCNIYISATIHSITEHVNGSTHKKMKVKKDQDLSKKKTQHDTASYKTIPSHEFEEVTEAIKNEFSNVIGYFINRKFFIKEDSLAFLKEVSSSPFFKCWACDKMVFKFAAQLHQDDYTHKQYMKSPIVDVENEFIREVKPGSLFQCGFCNEYFGSWSLVQKHMKTSLHRISRRASESMAREILMCDREPTQTMFKMLALKILRSSFE